MGWPSGRSRRGLAANLVYAWLVVNRNAPQLATGLAFMFFGVGMSALIGKPYVGQMAPGLPKYPLVGPQSLLFRYDLLVYLAVALAPAVWFFLFRTRWGLKLRAVGESPAIAYAAGVSPAAVRYSAAAWAGLLAAVGGALVFGDAVVLQLQLQAQGIGFSAFLMDMIPHVLTLVVLLIWGRGCAM